MKGEVFCKSEKEFERTRVIQMALDGFIPNRKASELLNLSVRQVIRLKNKHKKECIPSFIHGNKGRKPKYTLPYRVEEKLSII